jgi:hypothetical protein
MSQAIKTYEEVKNVLPKDIVEQRLSNTDRE